MNPNETKIPTSTFLINTVSREVNQRVIVPSRTILNHRPISNGTGTRIDVSLFSIASVSGESPILADRDRLTVGVNRALLRERRLRAGEDTAHT